PEHADLPDLPDLPALPDLPQFPPVPEVAGGMSDPCGTLGGMTRECHITSTDVPDLFSEMVGVAAYGGTRFVITRYGREMVAVVGLQDLRYLRDRENGVPLGGCAPEGDQPPELAADETAETLKERIRR